MLWIENSNRLIGEQMMGTTRERTFELGRIIHREADQTAHIAVTIGPWGGEWGIGPRGISMLISAGNAAAGINLTPDEARTLSVLLAKAADRAPEIAARVLALEEQRADLRAAQSSLIQKLMSEEGN